MLAKKKSSERAVNAYEAKAKRKCDKCLQGESRAKKRQTLAKEKTKINVECKNLGLSFFCKFIFPSIPQKGH